MNRPGIVVVITILIALAVGTWINSLLPGRIDTLYRPFENRGTLGQAVPIRTGTVTVLSVRAAPKVSVLGTGVTASSTGLFLIATVSYEAKGDSFSVTPFQLRAADGRVFGGAQATSLLNACGASQPGIPVVCEIPLEVAPDALPGSSLVVFNYSSGGADDRAVIDLGITSDAVKTWTAAAPATLAPSRFGTVR